MKELWGSIMTEQKLKLVEKSYKDFIKLKVNILLNFGDRYRQSLKKIAFINILLVPNQYERKFISSAKYMTFPFLYGFAKTAGVSFTRFRLWTDIYPDTRGADE